MSHFTVAVICDHPDDIIRLMAPYQENNMGDCPVEFMKFCEADDDIGMDWENQKDKHESHDAYLEHCGYVKDEKSGKWGYYENPNAQWDWYELGGRWMGSLLIEKDSFIEDEAGLGRPGVFGNDPPNTPKNHLWVDICRVNLVKWDKMKEIKNFELLKNEGMDGDIWEIITSEDHPKRRDYTWFKADYFKERYGTKENYVEAQSSFGTYAVITPDGKWHSPGEMGWFGTSSDTHEEASEFQNGFHKNFIEPFQDKFIAIMDCHT